MMNSNDDDKIAREEERRREEEKRREAWIGLLGAAFLGAFLLILFQGPIL
jgi:hypothetical protein